MLRSPFEEKTADLERRCGGQTISRSPKSAAVADLGMLTGDFLAPYLLSSIDMGVGMMKMRGAPFSMRRVPG